VGGLFEYEALNDLNLKGLSDPIQAWRVTGESDAESRFEAAAIRGLTPMVGREEEIGLLLRRWELAKEGDGQVVLLSGEAGVGKSRILRGFQERIKGELHNRILYFCSPYHQNTALQPSVEQFGRALRFQKDDSAARKLDKLDNALTQLGLPLREYAPVFAALLSLSTEGRYPPLALPPGEAMTKTLEALVMIIEKMAAQDPVLMIVEDVHCIDASTRELLNHLVERVASIPILLVITYRLEFESPWSGHGQVTVITLNRLSRRETAGMILEVTGGKALPEELVEQLVKKTDGVALFVEELTKTIIESDLLEDAGDRYVLNGPLPALAVPTSLQDSLMARLDRLAPVKEVAQLAATIGRRFSQELLMAVSEMERPELDAALAQLVDAELVYRHGMAPDVSYEFKHALVQDAAYASLLRSKRQQYHRRIAQVLEKDVANTAQTEPALLAHHYTEAGLPGQAIGYWLKAGELLHDQGSVDMSMNTYRKALELAEDDDSRCRALIGIAEGMRVTDEYDAALRALDEAQGLAGTRQLDGELARIHHLRGNLYFPLGNVSGCLEEHELALLHAQKAGDTENEARALSGLGDAHYSRGRMRTSLDHFTRCIELARQHDYLHIAVGNQYMVAWTRFYMNEVRGALADALDAVDSAVEIGYLRAEMVARLTASRALVELAELDAAAEHIERGLSIADALGANRFKPFLMIFRARVDLARNGHRSGTVELMRSAAEISRETSVGFLGPWVLSIFALSCDDPDEGSRALTEGEEILRGDCVGHNYFAFYRTAMEASLQWRDWGAADRYALALEDYCRPEPLPRCDFYITRGRALAEFGRSGRSDELVTRLAALREQANEIGLLAAVPALDSALGGAR
jgi:tetratricopeptide (TPR) repeat protein